MHYRMRTPTRENVLKTKSFAFSLRAIGLNKHLVTNQKEYILSKQVLRSATSIGANIVEGNRAQSRSDFIHKLSIALKEADETEYWLRLLHAGGYITEAQATSLLTDCLELQKMLTSSIKTAKARMES